MLHSIRAMMLPKGKPSIGGFIVTALVPAILVTVLVMRILQANSALNSVPQLANPNAAPDFTISVWNGTPGEKIHLAALRGKPVVLNFWAWSCEPCKTEAPIFAAAAKTYAAQGAVFIGVAVQTPQPNGEAFLKQHDVTYPCGPDPSSNISTDYGITGLPQTILIDRSGIIVRRFPGQIIPATFDPAVLALVNGERQPAATPSPTAPPATPQG